MNEISQLDTAPLVEIVVPVRNEVRDLAPSVRRLIGYLRDGFPCMARVTIADNGSTDGTWSVAQSLAASFPGVVRLRRLTSRRCC